MTSSSSWSKAARTPSPGPTPPRSTPPCSTSSAADTRPGPHHYPEGRTPMSNHFSAANLKHPGDDARLDLTDLFVFASPGNPDRTVLIMDSNPFLEGNGFHPDAVYRFNIDNNGDSLADAAFSFTFSELKDGRQTATAHYATGREAQTR